MLLKGLGVTYRPAAQKCKPSPSYLAGVDVLFFTRYRDRECTLDNLEIRSPPAKRRGGPVSQELRIWEPEGMGSEALECPLGYC